MLTTIHKVGFGTAIVASSVLFAFASGESANESTGRTSLSVPVQIVLSGNTVGVSGTGELEARFRSIHLSDGIPLKSTPAQGLFILMR